MLQSLIEKIFLHQIVMKLKKLIGNINSESNSSKLKNRDSSQPNTFEEKEDIKFDTKEEKLYKDDDIETKCSKIQN